MGIVSLRGRDAVRLSPDARERAGEPGSSEAHGVGPGTKSIVAKEGARHRPSDRTRVRRDPSLEGETLVAS